MMIKAKSKSLFLLFLLIPAFSICQVRLPKLISNGMVLQRDIKVKVWGWASEGEKISVSFIGSIYRTTANKNGEWEVILPELKAGGPYTMKIDASNSIIINDILIGDVWICSGQSNMGSLRGFSVNYQEEIAQSENKFIRHFSVSQGFSLGDRYTDLRSGRWISANPKDVMNFAAVGYFFAKALYDVYKVPIGLINSSVGGSSAEAWISQEAIKSSYPKYYQDIVTYRVPGYLDKINKDDNERTQDWNRRIKQNDEGFKDPQNCWNKEGLNTINWEKMNVPGLWRNTKTGPMAGVVWFRKEFDIPAAMIGKQGVLLLGRIVDADSVYINGKFIGSIGSQWSQRNYRIPDNLLREGSNIIVVRIVNFNGYGGFVPGKPYRISTNENSVSLEGEWKYRIGVSAEPLQDRLATYKIPSGLFTSMIAPLLNYKIKGVVWYQGESNTFRAGEHYDLFKLLIKDWRSNWNCGDFSFLYVQLPNYIETYNETTMYDWPLLRESQLKALTIPNTGMAVTIDIGEEGDIHPGNKKDVGIRLALAARKVAYGDKSVIYSGPVYKSMTINGNKITLTFSNSGSGLVSGNGGELRSFEICGIDNNWISAKAIIEAGKVVVWNDQIPLPVAVRYAWRNNPEGANLYNKEGLPASPFRTSDLY
jgi:sialate O-acetylesterase